VDVDHIQSVVEVLAERAFLDASLEIAIGRGNDADVDRLRLRVADLDHLALLKRAEQLHLKRGRHFADLVEKQSAAVRCLEATLSRRHGSGERAANVTEKLRFHQVLRNGATVDDDEWLLRAIRTAVKLACDELLPGASFASDQHADVRDGHLFDTPKNLEKARATADDVTEALRIELLGHPIAIGG
jgi:hypothetical protein